MNNAGHSVIQGNYAYLFGGNTQPGIFRAPLNNMLNWEKLKYDLPSENLWGNSGISLNNHIYIFGGCASYQGINSILVI